MQLLCGAFLASANFECKPVSILFDSVLFLDNIDGLMKTQIAQRAEVLALDVLGLSVEFALKPVGVGI